jgi:hypothetical protein
MTDHTLYFIGTCTVDPHQRIPDAPKSMSHVLCRFLSSDSIRARDVADKEKAHQSTQRLFARAEEKTKTKLRRVVVDDSARPQDQTTAD